MAAMMMTRDGDDNDTDDGADATVMRRTVARGGEVDLVYLACV